MSAFRDRFTVCELCAIAGSAAVLLWSIPGLFVNPDFSIGDDLTSETWLWVDMNGWHGVSGFLVVVPVLLSLGRQPLLSWVMIAAVLGLMTTAVWAMFSSDVAFGLFVFPNQATDAFFHVLVSSIFAAGVAHYRLVERSASAQGQPPQAAA